MDIILAFRKYIKNYRIIFSISILFLFILFLINPLFSLFGGTLNLSYDILNVSLGNAILTIIVFIVFTIMFSLIQTIIIFKISNEYDFSGQSKIQEIKGSFFELSKFNIIFFLIIYTISVILYNYFLLNNIVVNIIFTILTLVFWFVPQIIIMEKEYIGKAMLISLNYFKHNWFYIINLFIIGFILILITFIIDVLLKSIIGTTTSTIFFVLFVIPFIEILKTEIYLDKYRLLKPL